MFYIKDRNESKNYQFMLLHLQVLDHTCIYIFRYIYSLKLYWTIHKMREFNSYEH